MSIAILDMEDEVFVRMVPWPEAQVRVDELITAIEDWRKDCRRTDHAVGYMKAERDYQRLGNKHHALLEKISMIEANSLQGILVKARAVKIIHADDDAIEFGDATDEALAASILNGLLALQGLTS